MPKPPAVSGRELVVARVRLGFVVDRQRGSHVVLKRDAATFVVPLHTLSGILRQAGFNSVDERRAML